MSGRVYLVGAGPGDPGLLTLRGQRCLGVADVVVHDDLVNRRLLEHTPAAAIVIDVGRPHGGEGRLTQEAITDLLVSHARAGRVVVRLKSGDPFVFGRGGEEALGLRRAGVPFEVVPGVTSAVAVPAYAGIPVTERDHASAVTFVTGHLACAPDEAPVRPSRLPWAQLARQGGTLVFLMGVKQLPAITEALMIHGMARDVPAAMIERGTTGAQRTVIGTVGTLAERAAAAAIRAPAIIVIGSVVQLRDQVAWLESRPLFGRRVLVTRPRAQAGAFATRLEDLGAEVVVSPTIEIAAPSDPAALDRAVIEAGTYDWIVFTSVNGVRVFFERLGTLGRDVRELASARLAAIGPETARELERRLVRPALVPDDYRAEGLLAAFAGHVRVGTRVLLPRAAGAREILPATLRERGAIVEEVVAYESVLPADADVEALRAAVREGGLDALTFTSSSTVRNFVALAGDEARRALAVSPRPVVACIGPITAATAREAGLPVDVVPATYTIPALVDAIVARFCNPGNDPLSEESR